MVAGHTIKYSPRALLNLCTPLNETTLICRFVVVLLGIFRPNIFVSYFDCVFACFRSSNLSPIPTKFKVRHLAQNCSVSFSGQIKKLPGVLTAWLHNNVAICWVTLKHTCSTHLTLRNHIQLFLYTKLLLY